MPAQGGRAAYARVLASRDLRLLLGAAFLRAIATGMAGVLLGIHLAKLDFQIAEIGLILSAGLWGAAGAALLVTLTASRLSRRRALLGLAALSAAGGIAAAWGGPLGPLLIAAFLGMLNGQGRDRGAALVLEQAAMPGVVGDAGRTRAFAAYNVVQDVGHALGALAAGMPDLLSAAGLANEIAALRGAFVGYALLFGGTLLLYTRLSGAVEAPATERGAALDPGSRRILVRISALFAIDSIAGGFIGSALLAYFFAERFGVSGAAVGLLFLGARALNAASHLGAAWLAERIGLVNTMVFTHIPSSLLLASAALSPEFWLAALLFLLREGLVEMDVPTRQSYVMAVVRPEARTLASGVTHLVRMGGWAVGPAIAGALMQGLSLAAPILVGAGLKVGYDIALYLSFRGVKPPEEGA